MDGETVGYFIMFVFLIIGSAFFAYKANTIGNNSFGFTETDNPYKTGVDQENLYFNNQNEQRIAKEAQQQRAAFTDNEMRKISPLSISQKIRQTQKEYNRLMAQRDALSKI